MSELARRLEQQEEVKIPVEGELVSFGISQSEVEEYAKLNAEIKQLEAKKEVLNKKMKKSVGESILQELRILRDENEELVLDYERFKSLDQSLLTEEERHRISELEAELEDKGLSAKKLKVLEKGDYTSALKLGSNLIQFEGLRADFVVQDKSKMNEDKAVAFLKAKGMKHLITTIEVPDKAGLESAIYKGELTAKEVAEACIEENLMLALTIRNSGG